MSAEDVAAQAQSDLFARNSKFQNQAYDAGLRDHEKDEAKAQFADSIAFAMDWAGKLPLPKMFTGKHL